MASIFFSYSHADEAFRDQLEKHLAMLKRQGRIDAWHDRKIVVGDNLDGRISEHLDGADIVLLLVSSDFLASEYCYGIELQRALERSERAEARVIPIILRPCDWKSSPLGKLLAAPADGKPVSRWPDRDEAWLNVVEAIKAALPTSTGDARSAQTARAKPGQASLERVVGPRSSNLRFRKEYSDADRSKYLKSAFEFMSRFFENSLKELEGRNSGIETEFTRVDAYRFTAVIYQNGRDVSQCEIRLNTRSSGFGSGISFSYDVSNLGRGLSYNEMLSVEADDQSMFLQSFGMGTYGQSQQRSKLSEEGAAELYWGMLIERLQ